MEWILINQKRNAAEIDRDNDGNSEPSSPQKSTILSEYSNFLPVF